MTTVNDTIDEMNIAEKDIVELHIPHGDVMILCALNGSVRVVDVAYDFMCDVGLMRAMGKDFGCFDVVREP